MKELSAILEDIEQNKSIDESEIAAVVKRLDEYTDDDSLNMLFRLGDILMSYGHLYDAEKIFTHLHAHAGHDDDVVSYLVDIYITDNRLDAALSLINDSPKTVVTLMIKAEIFQQLNMADVSFNLLNEALTISDDVIIHFALAELHFYEGNILEALEAYTKILESEEIINGVNIHLRLAKLYLLQMEYKDALRHYDKVDIHSYQNEDIHDKAVALMHNEQNENAKALLYRVIDNEPYYRAAYFTLIDILEREAAIQEAIEVAESYLLQDKENAMMYNRLGSLYFKNNQETEALDALYASLELDNTIQSTLTHIFEILLLLGMSEEIERFDALIDRAELAPDAQYLLAKIEAENENYDEAEALYESAYNDLSHAVPFMTDYYYFLLEIASPKRYNILEALIKIEPDNIEWVHEKERIDHEEY